MHKTNTTLLDHLSERLAIGAVVVVHGDGLQLGWPPRFGLKKFLHLARLGVVSAFVRQKEKLCT